MVLSCSASTFDDLYVLEPSRGDGKESLLLRAGHARSEDATNEALAGQSRAVTVRFISPADSQERVP